MHICRHVGANGGGPELLRAVPPQVLSAVLTSPQLVGKKNVGNVTELFQLLPVSHIQYSAFIYYDKRIHSVLTGMCA